MGIRDAVREDLAGIFDIYDPEVLRGVATFETRPKTEQERLAWFDGHDRACYPILVWDEDDRVLGWARLQPWSPRPAYSRAAENSVYVHAACRGRGVGRGLMKTLLSRGGVIGLRTVIARICESCPDSVAFHESLGFRTIGLMRRVGEKFGRVLDVRIMDYQYPEPPG